jgi:hypothetical protein
MLRRRDEDRARPIPDVDDDPQAATIAAMNTLILAAEAAADYAGDDFQVVAWVMVGIALVITAVATIVVTPGPDHHDH